MRSSVLFLALPAGAFAQTIPLKPDQLQGRNVKVEASTYKGRGSVHVSDAGADSVPDGERFAVVAGTDFQDGVIEVELAGDTLPGTPPTARGFVGIAFRVPADGSRYECLYLRPKNGRAPDQLQRNHSTQYIANPDFPWQKLREETPGKYESYVDLVPGEWTKVKIDVRGTKARLYVGAADQPVLVVDDLKHGVSHGAIALWIGPGTDAHFANLRIAK